MILEDAREFIFPIFSVESKDNGIWANSRIFLGTGFLVTKKGHAITAGHVLPLPHEIDPSRRLIAVIRQGGEEKVCWINNVAKFDNYDLALIKVNINDTKYLEVSDVDVSAGQDVCIIGVPSHETRNLGKEMRILKGHVTFSNNDIELNFAIPAGMSGSPVFLGSKVIGIAKGLVHSEELEERTEELEVISNIKEQITITKIVRMIHYGVALPFSLFASYPSPMFEGDSLLSYIDSQNGIN